MDYVTLFDENYFSKGMALYQSLESVCDEPFTLYILPLGNADKLIDLYCAKRETSIKIISIEVLFEAYPILREIEKERSYTEFCYTLSSFVTEFCLKTLGVKGVVYLDSDIYFYYNPIILLEQMKHESVLILEHNYYFKYDNTERAGKFCVEFLYFKNSPDGLKVLDYWRRKCEEECPEKPRNGKFGDQKYLDDWESRFEGIVLVNSLFGAGLAVWNIDKYDIEETYGSITVTDKITKKTNPLIFYHFTMLTKLSSQQYYLGHIQVADRFKQLLYKEYIDVISVIEGYYCSENVTSKTQFFSKYRFMPIPFVGETKIDLNIESIEQDRKKRARAYLKSSSKPAGEILYEMKHDKGNWISVSRITDCSEFEENFHEILWGIIKHELYDAYPTIGDCYREIFNRYKNNERIMVECDAELFKNYSIEYPMVDTVEYARFSKQNNEDEVVIKELPIYEENVISI